MTPHLPTLDAVLSQAQAKQDIKMWLSRCCLTCCCQVNSAAKPDSNSHVLWCCMPVQANARLIGLQLSAHSSSCICSAFKLLLATAVETPVCMCLGAAHLDQHSLLHCVIYKAPEDAAQDAQLKSTCVLRCEAASKGICRTTGRMEQAHN